MKLRWSKSSRLLQRVAFLAMVQRITFNLEKKKAFAKENFWFTLYKQPDLLTIELLFKLRISQRYIPNLERNWKNYVCIGVKNIANL